jgi:hypothetical protein
MPSLVPNAGGARPLLSGLAMAALLCAVGLRLWIANRRHQKGPPLTTVEKRVRLVGATLSAAAYGLVFLAFTMAPRAWVQSHPRVLVGSFILPVFGFLGFIFFPALSRRSRGP